jgi:hypothetical protein
VTSFIQKTNKKLNGLLFLLCSAPAFAVIDNSSTILLLPPRASIWGSSGTNTFGESDVMIPIWGNPNQTFYGDISGKYGDDRGWYASGGLGGRKIIHNTILGAYLFTDYNKTPNANYFTVVNPGIEFMNNQWDGHINSYFPVASQSDLMGIFTADQLGLPTTSLFRGHAEYAPLFDLVENVGPGVDLEIGRTFNLSYLNRARVFVGGYYFDPKYTSEVNGVEAGFELPLKYQWASVEVRDSYDNINHNTILLTLRFTLGGLDKRGEANIHDRMLDRIPRHIANLSNGDGIPSKKTIIDNGRTALIRDNIWFFKAAGTLSVVQGFQSCTFEHPCFGFAQTQIDTINALSPNANFYLSSGTYNNPNLGLAFRLRNGQNVFGRTNDFSQIATGNNRPLLNDSLFLEGNNNVYNVRVNGQSQRNLETGGLLVPFQVGILARSFSTGIINIYNSDMNATSTTSNVIGFANNSAVAQVNIYNSNMTSSLTNAAGGISIGAGNLHPGSLNIYNSSIFNSNSDTTNNFNLSFGLVNNESGVVNISNSVISTNLVHGGLVAGVLNNSSLGLGLGTINITGSTISVTGDDVGLAGGVLNQANNFSGKSANVNINQSAISVTSNNNGGGIASGIMTTGDGTVSINNSVIYAAGNSGSISGIVVSDPNATANFQNTIISLITSGTAVGTPTQNAGTLNDNGGNQCFENGVVVPC